VRSCVGLDTCRLSRDRRERLLNIPAYFCKPSYPSSLDNWLQEAGMYHTNTGAFLLRVRLDTYIWLLNEPRLVGIVLVVLFVQGSGQHSTHIERCRSLILKVLPFHSSILLDNLTTDLRSHEHCTEELEPQFWVGERVVRRLQLG